MDFDIQNMETGIFSFSSNGEKVVLIVRNAAANGSGEPRDEGNICVIQETANTMSHVILMLWQGIQGTGCGVCYEGF